MNIENKKQLATIIFAGGLGLLTAFLTSQYVQSQINKQTEIIAAQYQKKNSGVIQEMELMRKDMRVMAQRQAELDRQTRALNQETQNLKQAQANLPQLIAQTRPAGGTAGAEGEEPVQIIPPFSLRTPQGKRAVTILIDSLSAVGGLINPGDRIDIIALLNIPKGFNPDGDKDKVTTVLFQNIQVLAVGTQFEPLTTVEMYQNQQRTRSLNLTLAVDPDEAGLLSFAQQNGKLQMALRSPSERTTETMDVASWDSLADYVLERQGTDLQVPVKKTSISISPSDDNEEIKPFVQIFRGGREL